MEMYDVVAVNIHNITAIDDTAAVGDYVWQWLSNQVWQYIGYISVW